MSERFKKTATVTVIEEESSFELIDEMLIEGEGNPVKRLIRLKGEGLVNDVRLVLSAAGLKSMTFFAGQMQGNISPEKYKKYYRQIESRDDFVRLSERVRLRLIEALRSS